MCLGHSRRSISAKLTTALRWYSWLWCLLASGSSWTGSSRPRTWLARILFVLSEFEDSFNTAWMIKFGRVSYPLIPMYLSFWTWRIYPSYLFSFKVTFCLHFILFGTELILLIIHETQRTLLGTFLFVVHTFWSFTIVQYFIGWDRLTSRWNI